MSPPQAHTICFGFSDVPWQELVGLFVNKFFLLLSCFLEGRNMKRLAQRFPLNSDSFSGDRLRKKKKNFFLTCFNIVQIEGPSC